MDTGERIQTLMHAGFGKHQIAAILGVDTSDIADYELDVSDVPTIGGGVDLAPLEGRVTTLEDAPGVDLAPLEGRVTTLEDAPGGGGAPAQYRLLEFGGVAGTVGTTFVEWSQPGYGHQSDLLDLTDPTAPTVKVSGVYFLTARLWGPVDEWYLAVSYPDLGAGGTVAQGAHGTGVLNTPSVAWFIAEGGLIRISVAQTDGVDVTLTGNGGLVCLPT